MGVKKGIDGPFVEVVGHTQGLSLKSPRNVEAKLIKGTTVKLSWDPPDDQRPLAWSYGVYYALSMFELEKAECKLNTTNTSVLIEGLLACEKYIFEVRIIGPIGTGPSAQPVSATTEYEHRAPPKNLKVTSLKTNSLKMLLTWESSCKIVDEPIGYEVGSFFFFSSEGL